MVPLHLAEVKGLFPAWFPVVPVRFVEVKRWFPAWFPRWFPAWFPMVPRGCTSFIQVCCPTPARRMKKPGDLGEKTVQSHSRLLCPIQPTPCYKNSLELHFWNDIFDRKARTALWAPCVQASAFDVSKQFFVWCLCVCVCARASLLVCSY